MVVVGASAGGIETIGALLSHLPPDFPAPIVVVLHTAATQPTGLPRVLAREAPLTAAYADDGEELKPGHVHAARPGHHLLFEESRLRVGAKSTTPTARRPSVRAAPSV